MHDPTAHLPDGLVDELAACREPAEQAATLPASCSEAPVVHRIEVDTVFRQGWVGVGRWDRWPGAGDYSAMDLAEVPVVVVRDDEGRLRAFANSCSHRSAEIMAGEGT